jgi:predicted nucleotidyltransferase
VDFDAIQRVLAALEREGVAYAIFGATALNVHGLARSTEDIDLFIAPTAENVERLKRALQSVFDDPSIEEW